MEKAGRASTDDSAAPAATPTVSQDLLPTQTKNFYSRSLDLLDAAGIRYTVGGAYCLASYAGIVRHTKDLDVFIKPDDRDRVLDLFSRHGCRTELTHPHWVAKAFDPHACEGEHADFVDIIYGSGNGICVVDDQWLDHALRGDVLGRPGGAPLTAPEEVIWSKAFVMERERFDGADIAHLILARGHALDWARLMMRFAGFERVLLAHLVLFGLIYPSERSRVPQWVQDELLTRMRNEPPTDEKICGGTLLSWSQYLVDVRERGFADARIQPVGNLTQQQVDRWTGAEK